MYVGNGSLAGTEEKRKNSKVNPHASAIALTHSTDLPQFSVRLHIHNRQNYFALKDVQKVNRLYDLAK